MKIMLVLPAASVVRVTNPAQQVPRRAMLRFSLLPLTTVAALTPVGHEVVICDENVSVLDFDAEVDLVGLSFMTALAPRAYEIAAEFRRRGKVVVAGGYHPSFCPEEVSAHVDVVIVGDAEVLWPRFLREYEAGEYQSVYRHECLCDLAATPPARNDLLAGNGKYYVTINAVQTGRGCSHGCRYCSITAFHQQTHRHRPLERVLEELAVIPRDFIFVDDNIIADRAYARQLFEAMVPLGKRWVSQCSLEIADDVSLLELARKAGCQGLFIGIESIDPDNLASVRKGFNRCDSYRERIARVRKAGIGIIAGIMVGLDHDDCRTFESLLAFLQASRIDAIQLNILTPLPGTPLFTDFERQGRIIDRDWSHYDFRHCVIQPVRMSAFELQQGADWLYAQFYRLDRIIVRIVRSIFRIGLLPAFLSLRLNLTYRYDNRREGIRGTNPARVKSASSTCPKRSMKAGFLRKLLQRLDSISSL